MIMNLRIRFVNDYEHGELIKFCPPAKKGMMSRYSGKVKDAENNIVGYYDLFED